MEHEARTRDAFDAEFCPFLDATPPSGTYAKLLETANFENKLQVVTEI